MRFLLLAILLACASQSLADLRADIDSEMGASFFSLNGAMSSYYLNAPERLSFSQWNAAFGFNQSKFQDANTGAITETRGRFGSLGAGINYDKRWNLDLTIFASSTPETKFAESGNFLQFFYSDKNDENRNWSWSLGGGLGKARVSQKISFQILNTLINRDIEIDKNESSLFLGVSSSDGYSARVEYQKYSYSRSKQDLQTAYASRFLNYYTTDLVSSIGGLPENSASVSATAPIGEEWDLSIIFKNTRLIVDDSEAKRAQFYLDRYFNRFSAGVGISRSETVQSIENSLLLRTDFSL